MKKLVIEFCAGTSCYLLGSQELMSMVEALPAEQRKQIALSGTACLQACGKGPSLRINGVLRTGMTPAQLRDIIAENLTSPISES